MPKLIKHYMVAEYKAVKKVSAKDDSDWNWRKKYIGYQGELYIMESVTKFPGKQYLCFTDHSRNWVTTGYGKVTADENTVRISTPNSIYEFEIIYDGGE